MILPALPFPAIDPVLVAVGPFAVRWYGVCFMLGIGLAWYWVTRLLRWGNPTMTEKDAGDFLVWATIGIVVGGRLGSVLFYNFDFYLANPLDILFIWRGGMSFHGGLLGTVVAIVWFCRRRGLNMLAVGDLIAFAGPIGFFLVRIANFINAELYGRVTDVPWAMVFPGAGPLPRHPSQLYEAALEGIVLFAILCAFYFGTRIRHRPGALIGVFAIGYAAARIFVELYRQPDAHIGFLFGGVTMGQLLSVPLLLFGLFMVWYGYRRAPRPSPP